MPALRRPASHARKGRRRRPLRTAGLVALGVGVLAAVLLTLYVGNRALVAKDALEQAQGRLTAFRAALGQPGAPSTARLAAQLRADTGKAAKQVDDPVWSAFEGLPWAGPNLVAFRETTELTDRLVRDGVSPVAEAADGLGVDSLKPRGGRIDIAPLQRLTPAVARLDDALRTADGSAARIDTAQVLPQLAQPIGALRSTIREALPVTTELRKVLPVLYPALGGEGQRHYLLIFQNNAEERASGGNPASMAMLLVDHGRISLGRQADSGDFPHPYRVPPKTWEGDWARIFGPHTSTYLTNITFTPDFPEVALMARSMWRDVYGGKVDGVISFDPVALSYLLRATGPVRLETGEELTADNAVQYLLSGVYARYTDPRMQDAVFASAAQSIFTAVTSGQGDPKAYLDQLKPMLDEQRLKAWSVRGDEQDLLLTSQAGNMLPADDAAATTFGVYNNDDATSKMSYYMDATVAVTARTCTVPMYSVTTRVTNTLQPSQVAGLTQYVLANQSGLRPGDDRQRVLLYGPVGARLDRVEIDGRRVVFGTNENWRLNTVPGATGMTEHRPAVRGRLGGRPVASVNITMGAGEHVDVRAVFSGGDGDPARLAVSHTPKVRPVPVTTRTEACG
ncbi:DUF4012 domain-containing protein [Amnibacterium setariae]|uniref:DUF4012 domain-containing protein n=1 Tax=Amnibacterium setariae TaxID=2306585 RepID=A0A3A1TSA8_9MICO|nr:DUF4012 domain-containing protein [Amnibacterium setariae]RIX26586.1 DUF4012 domain-containing protein [Amnibacterium setariae]